MENTVAIVVGISGILKHSSSVTTIKMSSDLIKFTKLRSAIDPNFWAKFVELKIDKFKLDEKIKIKLWGSYSLRSVDNEKINPLVLDCTGFNENLETTSHNAGVACCGYMVNTNTYETFRQINPEQFIDSMGKCIIDSIIDGTALEEPWRLSVFLLFSYSDLKRYRFHYWIAHPTPFFLPEIYHDQPPKPAQEKFTVMQMNELHAQFSQLDSRLKHFFTVFISEDNISVTSLAKGVEYIKSNYENEGNSKICNKVYFAFYDPCTNVEPGWPLRSLLCLLLWHCPTYFLTQNINILSIRGEKCQNSMIFTLKTKKCEDQETLRKNIFENHLVGWELNAIGKMGPNIADLSSTLDPSKLSDEAINLNLKLMKWRLVPNLNLEKINSFRCLLLGAGTLGCSVARALLGWGINNITFVDGSTVSHSNTVRQSLYSHQDAVQRRFKAEAAKDALLNIRPNMNAGGFVLQIPMPGHVVGQSMMETTKAAVKKLEELMEQSDVIFLLLDSREARWLPTLLSAAMNKIAINAALGFDSYTVQRHGTRSSSNSFSPDLTLENPIGRDLGCYFCNDVTQPGNSQNDRTLDQQCTVSRPGLSQIAAGLAVELLMAISQHPQGIEAAALMAGDRDELRSTDNDLVGLLGGVPHTIRGSLWSHDMRLTITHRFPACTACSLPLIKEYRKRGFDFILDACNIPNYLEELSGLQEILKRPDLDELCYAIDTSSDDED